MSLEQVKQLDTVITSLMRQRTQLDRSIDDAIAIRDALVSNLGVDYAELLERYRFRRPGGLPPRKVTVDGVQFDSIGECARIMDIDKKTVKERCHSPHFAGWQMQDAVPS